MLFGEQLAEGDFRIVKATQQALGGGNTTRFNRRGFHARTEIKRLHNRYGGHATRFNYLGEWHSHPNVPAFPSVQDELTMRELLADQSGAVNFLVLAIVRLGVTRALEIGAFAYLTSGHKVLCKVEPENNAYDNGD